jgi:hypothetical protein
MLLFGAMLRNRSCVAMRSAADCSVSQIVWIMLEPIAASLWQTNFELGVNEVFSLTTTTGAVEALMTGSCAAHPTRASTAEAMKVTRMFESLKKGIAILSAEALVAKSAVRVSEPPSAYFEPLFDAPRRYPPCRRGSQKKGSSPICGEGPR